MADNVGYTPGTGATVAADNIDGALHQRVKISVGADGVATDVSNANPIPIDIGTNSSISLSIARIINLLLAPLGYSRDLQRYRNTAIIESGTVTTVTTCTNVVNLGSLGADRLVLNQNIAAWSVSHRARIT